MNRAEFVSTSLGIRGIMTNRQSFTSVFRLDAIGFEGKRMKLLRNALPASLRTPAAEFLRLLRDPRGHLARGLLETRRQLELTMLTIGDDQPLEEADATSADDSSDERPLGTVIERTTLLEELQLLGLQLSHAGVTRVWQLAGGESDLVRALRQAVSDEEPTSAVWADRESGSSAGTETEATAVSRLDLLELENDPTKPISTVRLPPGLKQLDYSGHWMGTSEIQRLARLRTLEMLSLDGLVIHDADLAVIARLGALRRLYLDGCPITDRGLRRLAPLRRLEVLSLRDTVVSAAGLMTLREFPRLREVLLSGTMVDDDSLHAVAGLPSIERLELDHTRVTGVGVRQLSVARSLRSVSLDGTAVSEADIDALLAAAGEIESISLFGTNVDRAAADRLAARWPNCEFDC